MKKIIYALVLLLCTGIVSARIFDLQSVTPDGSCSVFGCVMYGNINMSGNTIYDANFVNATLTIVEHDPIFEAWLNTTYGPENQSIWQAINALNQSINSSAYVKKSGDTMTGALNMSNQDIQDVNILYVHNISGRSPITIMSPVISQTNITATNFYGNFQGTNGTIYGVNINNGSIVNLHVTGPDATFDGNVSVNGTVSASDYNLQGDNVWINKENLTFVFNETKLQAEYYNKTQVDALIANVTQPPTPVINDTVIEQVNCDGTCTTVTEPEYIY